VKNGTAKHEDAKTSLTVGWDRDDGSGGVGSTMVGTGDGCETEGPGRSDLGRRHGGGGRVAGGLEGAFANPVSCMSTRGSEMEAHPLSLALHHTFDVAGAVSLLPAEAPTSDVSLSMANSSSSSVPCLLGELGGK
jgi:hypothetical protein